MSLLNDNRNAIVMAALKLSKAHTRWKTNKGSSKSFGKAKAEFIKEVEHELTMAHMVISRHLRNPSRNP